MSQSHEAAPAGPQRSAAEPISVRHLSYERTGDQGQRHVARVLFTPPPTAAQRHKIGKHNWPEHMATRVVWEQERDEHNRPCWVAEVSAGQEGTWHPGSGESFHSEQERAARDAVSSRIGAMTTCWFDLHFDTQQNGTRPASSH